MLKRWIKRISLLVVMVLLVLIPTQLAHGPSQVQAQNISAAAPVPAAPFQSLSPTVIIIAGLTLLVAFFSWRRKHTS